MSAVFTHDEEQRRLAVETGAAAAREQGAELKTLIEPLDTFTLAEGYHQKYSLRRLREVTRELEAIYPELEDFVRSTAATRLNAFAGGDLGREELQAIAPELGLSPAALERLFE